MLKFIGKVAIGTLVVIGVVVIYNTVVAGIVYSVLC